jgi:hypothetical protein
MWEILFDEKHRNLTTDEELWVEIAAQQSPLTRNVSIKNIIHTKKPPRILVYMKFNKKTREEYRRIFAPGMGAGIK